MSDGPVGSQNAEVKPQAGGEPLKNQFAKQFEETGTFLDRKKVTEEFNVDPYDKREKEEEANARRFEDQQAEKSARRFETLDNQALRQDLNPQTSAEYVRKQLDSENIRIATQRLEEINNARGMVGGSQETTQNVINKAENEVKNEAKKTVVEEKPTEEAPEQKDAAEIQRQRSILAGHIKEFGEKRAGEIGKNVNENKTTENELESPETIPAQKPVVGPDIPATTSLEAAESFEDVQERLKQRLNDISKVTGKLSSSEELKITRDFYLNELGYRMDRKGLFYGGAELKDDKGNLIMENGKAKRFGKNPFGAFDQTEKDIKNFLEQKLKEKLVRTTKSEPTQPLGPDHPVAQVLRDAFSVPITPRVSTAENLNTTASVETPKPAEKSTDLSSEVDKLIEGRKIANDDYNEAFRKSGLPTHEAFDKTVEGKILSKKRSDFFPKIADAQSALQASAASPAPAETLKPAVPVVATENPIIKPAENLKATVPGFTEASEKASELTQEAKDLLETVARGGVPAYVTNNLSRILKENGISQGDIDKNTPLGLVGMLKNKVNPVLSSPVVPSAAENLEAAVPVDSGAAEISKSTEEKKEQPVAGASSEATILTPTGEEYIIVDPKEHDKWQRKAAAARVWDDDPETDKAILAQEIMQGILKPKPRSE